MEQHLEVVVRGPAVAFHESDEQRRGNEPIAADDTKNIKAPRSNPTVGEGVRLTLKFAESLLHGSEFRLWVLLFAYYILKRIRFRSLTSPLLGAWFLVALFLSCSGFP
jgi:hypothetical protein